LSADAGATQTHFMLARSAASTPRGASSKTRMRPGSTAGLNFEAASSNISGFGFATETWDQYYDFLFIRQKCGFIQKILLVDAKHRFSRKTQK
jgi:hypothetical protein